MISPALHHDEGDGESVVLLHGWPLGPHVWRRLVPLLATRFRVLIPELTGADLGEQANVVLSTIDALHLERVALVGHSFGGGVAQLIALERPDLVGALVLIDSIAFDRAPPPELGAEEVVRSGAVEIDDLDPRDVEVYSSPASPPPAPFDLSSRVPEMAGWNFPVLLLWGERDPFVPVEVAERLGDAILGSTLGVVPDSGHLLLDDAFDPVGPMIAEWLRAMYLGAPHGHEGVVMLQLEKRPPWVEMAELEIDDEEPVTPDEADQEVGRQP